MNSNQSIRSRAKKVIVGVAGIFSVVVAGFLYDYLYRYDKAVFYVGHS